MTNRLARGFFHRDISGVEAERLLQEKNIPGCFLVRPSRTKSDAYVLSVRRANGAITHIRIQRTNDKFNLGEKQESFSTLYDMIDYYRRNIGDLREKNGEIIILSMPVLAQMPTYEKYYHGSISHDQVVSLLNKPGQIGAFLVRDSETTPENYVICLKISDEISNIKVKYLNGQLFLEGKGHREQVDRFQSLDDLIHFYLKHTLITNGGVSVRLNEVCSSNWFYARDIRQRCEYLSKIIPSQNGQKNGFCLEFESLNQQSESQSSNYQKKIGEKAENRLKNRFKNILPYDETRVILKNYPPTDYMNANRIRSYYENIPREYIATQGPLPATVNDFWHMIQQEYVKCIVMITREIEAMRNKCARYWPDLHTTKQYGTVTVENLHEINYSPRSTVQRSSRLSRKSQFPTSLAATTQQSNDDNCYYRLRLLRITTEDRRTWEIYHWQYLAWSDHDSPLISNQTNPNPLDILIEFFENILRSNPIENDSNVSPMIVHCSAGIGRSGATIAIDTIINRIRIEGVDIEIDIPNIVQYIRSQRSGLVQTERQYELIYRVIEYFVEKSQHTSKNINKQ